MKISQWHNLTAVIWNKSLLSGIIRNGRHICEWWLVNMMVAVHLSLLWTPCNAGQWSALVGSVHWVCLSVTSSCSLFAAANCASFVVFEAFDYWLTPGPVCGLCECVCGPVECVTTTVRPRVEWTTTLERHCAARRCDRGSVTSLTPTGNVFGRDQTRTWNDSRNRSDDHAC